MNHDYTPTESEVTTVWARAQIDRENSLRRYVTADDQATFMAEIGRLFRQVKADAWDEGWAALADEEDRQRMFPHHPITRTNPYRITEENS